VPQIFTSYSRAERPAQGQHRYKDAADYLASLLAINDGQASTVGNTEFAEPQTQMIAGRNWTILSYRRPFKAPRIATPLSSRATEAISTAHRASARSN
jgi:hypothetical protein